MLTFFKLLATRLGTATSAMRAHVRGFGSSGDDENAEGIDDSEILQPIGFASRAVPSDTSEAIALRISDRVLVLYQIDKSVGQAQLADHEVGEARVYAPKEPTCVIRCRADGSIEIASKTGQNILLFADGQTADKPVAKEGSVTSGHTHGAGTMTAGPYPVVGITASATDTIATGAGAQRVRVPAT